VAKRARADLVIDNDGTLADLDARVRTAWDTITARARRP
jgi:dephospho-CoA kinase